MPEFVRLSKTVTPVNYTVELKPDLEKFTFDGQIIIEVNVKHLVLN